MVADDHGREALGCYGSTVPRTPNLDALARGGTCFQNAFCTTPSCAASRSVILTGLHNHTNGTYGHTHGKHHFSCFDGVQTLPHFLNGAGYRTGCIGKKHYAPASIYPFGENLDTVFDQDCIRLAVEHGKGLGPRMNSSQFRRDDVRMAETCRDFIEGEAPFFLYWCSHNPHRANRIEDHPLQPNDFGNPIGSYPGDEEQLYSEDEVQVPAWLPDLPETRAELAQYYQSVSRLDRGVGRLMEILKETGKFEDTLIFYISDNGAAFPASKTTLYDPGMRLPCIVHAPGGARAGDVREELVAWYDLVPTMLDYAGFEEMPKGLFGRSIRPLLEGPPGGDWREEIFASHTFHEITNYYPMRVIRTGRWKFIWNIAHPLPFSFAADLWSSSTWQAARRADLDAFGCRSTRDYLHRPRFELYDLQNDPNESDNVAGLPGNAETVERFCEQLRKFQKETGDVWLSKWEYE